MHKRKKRTFTMKVVGVFFFVAYNSEEKELPTKL